MVCVRVMIEGRVQGVGFRYQTCFQAGEHGVNGWVRNRPDGHVEAEFEGPESAVDAMLEWCRRGPAGARVERVEILERTTQDAPRYSGFAMRG